MTNEDRLNAEVKSIASRFFYVLCYLKNNGYTIESFEPYPTNEPHLNVATVLAIEDLQERNLIVLKKTEENTDATQDD